MCMYHILRLESFPAGLLGRHVRRFPAAEFQNLNPQSLSSTLINSYRHGACGQRQPGFQALSSATVTAEVWRSEASAEGDLLRHVVQNWTWTKYFISYTSGFCKLHQGLKFTGSLWVVSSLHSTNLNNIKVTCQILYILRNILLIGLDQGYLDQKKKIIL